MIVLTSSDMFDTVWGEKQASLRAQLKVTADQQQCGGSRGVSAQPRVPAGAPAPAPSPAGPGAALALALAFPARRLVLGTVNVYSFSANSRGYC